MVIKEKTTSHIYTKDYYERVKQLIETYNLNPKISLSKRLYLYKKILFQVSLFDSVNKDRTTYGKGYFNLKILSKENRKTFGTIKINKQKYEVISVLRDELIEIGLISLISKSNSLFHKSALYQINPDFYTSLVPKKEDVLNLLIDIRGLRFSDTGKLIKTTDTDIVTDSFTVYEEETQLSDREATVMGSLRQLKFDFGTEFQETVSNWIPTASLPQISSCMGNIGRLENGDLYAHDGKKSERIYHNYCNINSELREFIGMKDKTSGELHRMKAIDMKSCQAYLLQKAISDASGDYKSLIDGSPEFGRAHV